MRKEALKIFAYIDSTNVIINLEKKEEEPMWKKWKKCCNTSGMSGFKDGLHKN